MTAIRPLAYEGVVNFAENPGTVFENMREVSPTVFLGVPRIWEKFHAGVTAKLAQATGVKARLMAWTRRVCGEVTALRNRGKEPGGALALQYSSVATCEPSAWVKVAAPPLSTTMPAQVGASAVGVMTTCLLYTSPSPRD